MNTFTLKLTACLCSPDLREKYDCLTWLIKHLIPLLDKDIGDIGSGALSEILIRQEQIVPEEMKTFRPFIYDNEDQIAVLEIVLASFDSPYAQDDLPFGVFTELNDKTEWFLVSDNCKMESLAQDVRVLNRMKVEIAAKRLCFVFIILSAVYWNPKSVLCQTAVELAHMFGFLPILIPKAQYTNILLQ